MVEKKAKFESRKPLRTVIDTPKRALFALIWVYRKLVSPLVRNRCKYHPSCSRYAVDAVRRYGVVKGTVLAVWRVLRCNPLSDGGVDYVRNQRVFKDTGAQQPVTH